jgi:hypothetical protein
MDMVLLRGLPGWEGASGEGSPVSMRKSTLPGFNASGAGDVGDSFESMISVCARHQIDMMDNHYKTSMLVKY